MSERPTLPKILFLWVFLVQLVFLVRHVGIIRIEQGREFHPMVWVAIGIEDHHWEECEL